jgi:hypothetical protein
MALSAVVMERQVVTIPVRVGLGGLYCQETSLVLEMAVRIVLVQMVRVAPPLEEPLSLAQGVQEMVLVEPLAVREVLHPLPTLARALSLSKVDILCAPLQLKAKQWL